MTYSPSIFRLLRHLAGSVGWSARLGLLTTGISCMAATIGGLSPTHSTADARRIDIRQLPVAFEAIDEDGASQRHHARFPNYDVILNSGAVSIRLSDHTTRPPRRLNRATSSNTATLELSFNGTSRASVPVGKGKLRGKANYFIGNDPKKWIKGVPLYGSVLYPDVYEGVDFLFQNNNGRLGYRIELDRGEAVRKIALRFSGHNGIRLNSEGEIEVSTAIGRATWTAPKAFWDTAQGLIRAGAAYAILDDGSVGFEIEGPLRSDPLIIDPELVFSTLLGGSGGDFITARDIADNGNIVVTGPTTSLNFPRSANPAQGNNAGFEDIFVTMLRPDASEIVFSTYLGGSSIEATNGIAAMADGSVSICGFTLSTNFPTTSNAIQDNISGFLSAFVSQLSQSGSTLPFSSYLGGSSQDNCTDMVTDHENRLLLSGYTASQNFPTTPNAKSTQYQGGTSDGFFSVLRLDQPNIEYSTFLGGSGSEFEVIQLDVEPGVAIEFGLAPWLTIGDDGDVYLAGTTTSPNFVTTPGAFMESLQGSNSGFIMRLAAEDYSLKASTLLGGDMLDGATSIALSSSGTGNGSVVVGGLTSSSNFPASSSAFQSAFGGGDFDGSLVVLDSHLQVLEYGTYVGGQGFDVFFADAAAGNRVHVGGMTSSTDLPSSPDALQPGFAGAVDGYLLTLNLGGKGASAVEFSTYFGGVGQDILSRPATTPDGGVLLFGSSEGFRTTAGVVGESYSGGPTDAAIFKVGGGGVQNPDFTSAGLTNSASFVAGDVAEEEIIALFGLFLADFSESFSLPLGTQLGGASVDITDSQGVTRPCLMYVASSTPTLDQLNFIIAEGTATGPGTLTVRRASGGSRSIAVNVVKAAPGIFTANAMGTGVPAANILRFGPSGVPIGGAELVTAAPIDLGPADQSVFLSLFLTGVRNGSTVQITINGVPMTTIFGPAPSPEFDGLDQLNVLIDRGLIGQGLVNVVVTVDGIVANVVQINIL
jgi:uncharacterized protein (TIGR03437 family)